MVISRDQRGMAVLMDAMLFLVVLSVLSAFLLMPGNDVSSERTNETARTFHSVMLAGEIPYNDGSALSQTSLEMYLIMISHDASFPSSFTLEIIESAVNDTLLEIKNMGMKAWWVLTVGGEDLIFGTPFDDGSLSLFTDLRSLSTEGTVVSCSLTIAG
ncbi:MAG TPA: hypothetical protein VMW85_00465 [Methanomassiliicoccales archaeon]|nr:hypothetical protein [Methanomassiliicoccales archaeon]